ncbi:ABC transporter substrate-binding protein [Chromohalobacter japonicus]|uniref:ABC transporter substrate-binding protein n=1 Tax=Chromohalobacter japonicus TaxID=223900 RepID=A0A1Q8THU5_9GAMM|nr:ABC transporter substrate-binding protein [Chromohalobacter japonicus]OLO13264.1 ABC transporter substrate-binding protein [Chromohalobacter japonicus]
MKIKIPRKINIAIAAGILGLSNSAGAQENSDKLNVGVFTFLSGPAAAYGEPGRRGAETIIDMINSDGGIEGRTIEANYIDEAQGTEGVITEYRQLANDPNYNVMIAALSSSNCLALISVADQLKMPTIGWNCDTHQLYANNNSEYFYRPNGSTIAEFVSYAAYLSKVNPNAERIAIINPDYSFGHDAAEIFISAMKAFNPDVEVVAELYPKLGASSYQTEISRLSSARPDVIFSNLWGGDLENFLRQAAPRRLLQTSQAVLALGESVLQSIDLPDGIIVGVLGDGLWMSPDAQSNPRTVDFVEKYHKEYGGYPTFPAMKMANSFMVMEEAVKSAMEDNGGTWPTREEIAVAMEGLQVETLTGEVNFRSDNEGLVDQIVGMTASSDKYDFPIISNMIRFEGDVMYSPQGEDPLGWVKSLGPDFLAKLPEPGSYN